MSVNPFYELTSRVWYDVSQTSLTVLMFVAFGIADLSHDLILTPGRSLLSKHSSIAGKEWIPRGNAMWSTMSNAGRLLGLTVSILPLHQIPILDAFSGPRIQAVFVFAVFVNSILATVSLVTAFRAPKSMPSLRDLDDNTSFVETSLQNASRIAFNFDTHQQSDVDVTVTDDHSYMRLNESDNEEIDPTSVIQLAEFGNTTADTGERNHSYTKHSDHNNNHVDNFNSNPLDPAEKQNFRAVLDANVGNAFAVNDTHGGDYEGETDVGEALSSFSDLELPLVNDKELEEINTSRNDPNTSIFVGDDHSSITTDWSGSQVASFSSWTWAEVFEDLRLMVFMPKEVRTVRSAAFVMNYCS